MKDEHSLETRCLNFFTFISLLESRPEWNWVVPRRGALCWSKLEFCIGHNTTIASLAAFNKDIEKTNLRATFFYIYIPQVQKILFILIFILFTYILFYPIYYVSYLFYCVYTVALWYRRVSLIPKTVGVLGYKVSPISLLPYKIWKGTKVSRPAH